MFNSDLRIIKAVVTSKYYFLIFLLLWLLTITIFIWLINLNLLGYILSTATLTFGDKIQFIVEAYSNYFKYLDNPVAFSSVVFSLLVALNFTLIVYLWRETKQRSSSIGKNSGAFVAMLGSHCISCGTSLVAPLITAVAGSGAFFSAERATTSLIVATVANVLGIILITWSIKSVITNIRKNKLAIAS